MKKKILVTGSNGLLGQKITDLALQNEDIELIASSTGPNRHPVKTGYKYLSLDITNPAQLCQVIISERPDCIINTAAVTNVDACEEQQEHCQTLNVDAVANLTLFCEQLRIHLIHLSTDFIFDGAAGPYREEDQPSPLSVYGRSKLASEKILQASACDWTIIRTILVYGIIGDMSRSNIVLWAKSALEKGNPIQVVNDQWRMPTLAEDLATACLNAASNRSTGIFHVSGEGLLSILEIVKQVADFWNLDTSPVTPVSATTLNQKAKRPQKTGFILDKCRQELKVEPKTLAEGLVVIDQQLKSLAQTRS